MPLAVTAVGSATKLLLKIHLLVKPVVINWLVKLIMVPGHTNAFLSEPNEGFIDTITLISAVSVQPKLLVAIN